MTYYILFKLQYFGFNLYKTFKNVQIKLLNLCLIFMSLMLQLKWDHGFLLLKLNRICYGYGCLLGFDNYSEINHIYKLNYLILCKKKKRLGRDLRFKMGLKAKRKVQITTKKTFGPELGGGNYEQTFKSIKLKGNLGNFKEISFCFFPTLIADLIISRKSRKGLHCN